MSASVQQIVKDTIVPKIERKQPLTNLTVQQVTQPLATQQAQQPKKGKNLLDRALHVPGEGLHYLGEALDLSGKYLARPTLGVASRAASSNTPVGDYIRAMAKSRRNAPLTWDLGPVDIGLGPMFIPGTVADVIAPHNEAQRKQVQKSGSLTQAWREQAKGNSFLENVLAEIAADPTTWITAGTAGAAMKLPKVASLAARHPVLAAETLQAINRLQDLQALPILGPLKGAKKAIQLVKKDAFVETKETGVLKKIRDVIGATQNFQNAGAQSAATGGRLVDEAGNLRPAFTYNTAEGSALQQDALRNIQTMNSNPTPDNVIRHMTSLDDDQRLHVLHNLMPTDVAAPHVIPYLKSIGALEDDIVGTAQPRVNIRWNMESGTPAWQATREEFLADVARKNPQEGTEVADRAGMATRIAERETSQILQQRWYQYMSDEGRDTGFGPSRELIKDMPAVPTGIYDSDSSTSKIPFGRVIAYMDRPGQQSAYGLLIDDTEWPHPQALVVARIEPYDRVNGEISSWQLTDIWARDDLTPGEKIKASRAMHRQLDQYNIAASSTDLSVDSAPIVHRQLIKQAIEAGEQIPENVLAEYPSLRRLAERRGAPQARTTNDISDTLDDLINGTPAGPREPVDPILTRMNLEYAGPQVEGIVDGQARNTYISDMASMMRQVGAQEDEVNLAVLLTDNMVRNIVARNTDIPTSEHLYGILKARHEPVHLAEGMRQGVRTGNFHKDAETLGLTSKRKADIANNAHILVNLFDAVADPNVAKPFLTYAHELAHVVEETMPAGDYQELLNVLGSRNAMRMNDTQSELFANGLERFIASGGLHNAAVDQRLDPILVRAYKHIGSMLENAWSFIRSMWDGVDVHNPEIATYWDNFFRGTTYGAPSESVEPFTREAVRTVGERGQITTGRTPVGRPQARTEPLPPMDTKKIASVIKQMRTQGLLTTKEEADAFRKEYKVVQQMADDGDALDDGVYSLMDDYGYKDPDAEDIADAVTPPVEAPAEGVRAMTTAADRVINRLGLTGDEATTFRAEFNQQNDVNYREGVLKKWQDIVRGRSATATPPTTAPTGPQPFEHRVVSTPASRAADKATQTTLIPEGTYQYSGTLANRTAAVDNKSTRKAIKSTERLLTAQDQAGLEKFLDADTTTASQRHAVNEHILANPTLDPNGWVRSKLSARGEYIAPPGPEPSSFGVRPTQKFLDSAGEARAARLEAQAAENNIQQIIAQVTQGKPAPMAHIVEQIVTEQAQRNPGTFANKSLWMNSQYAPLFTQALFSTSEREARANLSLMFSRMNMHRAASGVLHPLAMRNIGRMFPETIATSNVPTEQVTSNNPYWSILSEKDMKMMETMQASPAVQKADAKWKEDVDKINVILSKYDLVHLNDNMTAGEIFDYVENGIISDPGDAKKINAFLKRYHMTPEALQKLIGNKFFERVAGIDRIDFHEYTVGSAYIDNLREKFVKEALADPTLELGNINRFWGSLGWIPRAWREQALVSPRYQMANWMDMIVRGAVAGINPVEQFGARKQAKRWGLQGPPEALFVGRAAQRNLGDLAKFGDRGGYSEILNAEMRPALASVPVVGEKVLSPIVRFNRAIARASDNTFREWAWSNGTKDYLLAYKPEFDTLVRRAVPGPNGVDIITQLNRVGAEHNRNFGIDFSPEQVHKFVISQGGSAAAANELSNAWRTAVENASQTGMDFARKTHLDYETSYNIESALFLKSWMPFHFFATRNLPWYLEQLASHPEMVNAWQAYQDISEQDRINMGLPTRYRGYMPLGDSMLANIFGPAQAYFNPLAAFSIFDQTKKLLSPNDFEEEPVPTVSRENVGRQLDKIAGVGLGVAPWFQIPMSMMGFYGPKDEPMPIFRWSSVINSTASLASKKLGGGPMDITGEGTMRRLQNAVRATTTEPVQRHTDSIYTDNAIVSRLQENMLQEIALMQAVNPSADTKDVRDRYITASQEGPGNVEWDRAAKDNIGREFHRSLIGFVNPFPTRNVTKNRLAIQKSQEEFYDLPEELLATKEFREMARLGNNAAALTQSFQRPKTESEIQKNAPTSGSATTQNDYSVMQWNGGVWGEGLPAPYNNLVLFRAYQKWITRQPEGSRSPTDFFNEYGIAY